MGLDMWGTKGVIILFAQHWRGASVHSIVVQTQYQHIKQKTEL